MATNNSDLKSLKIQFYAVSGVLAFLVVVLIAVVIDLFVKVRKLRNDEEDEDVDEEGEIRERPPPPSLTSGFSFPKPNISKNWQDDDTEVRRKNDQNEFSLPKPALSKSWQAFPGDRNQPKRNQENNFRHDDDMSDYSYDGNGKNTGSAFRNPLSGNNNSERKYKHTDNRMDRQSRPPGFKLPSTSGNSFHQGDNNFGIRRDLQHNNNYY